MVNARGVTHLRPKMLNVRAMRVQAVHTALPIPHHRLQACQHAAHGLGLSGAFPVGSDVEFSLPSLFVRCSLPSGQKTCRNFGQGDPLNASHCLQLLTRGGKQLKLFGFGLLVFAEYSTCLLLGHEFGIFRTPCHSPG